MRAPWPTLFEGVPWSTPGVLAATLARAEALGLGVRLLPPWFDVDTAADLYRLRSELAAAAPGGPTRTARFLGSLA